MPILRLFILGALLANCHDSEVIQGNGVFTWKQIHLNTEGSVNAITGSLDSYILIGVGDKLLRSSDNTITWNTVLTSTSELFTGFSQDGDSLFAHTNFSSFFSLDEGISWLELPNRYEPDPLPEEITNSIGQYQLEISEYGECMQPAKVRFRRNAGENWEEIFDQQLPLRVIYAEGSSIYLGGYQATWNQEIHCFETETDEAVLLIGDYTP